MAKRNLTRHIKPVRQALVHRKVVVARESFALVPKRQL
jgi:hypothetical protein